MIGWYNVVIRFPSRMALSCRMRCRATFFSSEAPSASASSIVRYTRRSTRSDASGRITAPPTKQANRRSTSALKAVRRYASSRRPSRCLILVTSRSPSRRRRRGVLDRPDAARNAPHDLVEAFPPVDFLELRERRDVDGQETDALALGQDLADVWQEHREGGQRRHRIEQGFLDALRLGRVQQPPQDPKDEVHRTANHGRLPTSSNEGV